MTFAGLRAGREQPRPRRNFSRPSTARPHGHAATQQQTRNAARGSPRCEKPRDATRQTGPDHGARREREKQERERSNSNHPHPGVSHSTQPHTLDSETVTRDATPRNALRSRVASIGRAAPTHGKIVDPRRKINLIYLHERRARTYTLCTKDGKHSDACTPRERTCSGRHVLLRSLVLAPQRGHAHASPHSCLTSNEHTAPLRIRIHPA